VEADVNNDRPNREHAQRHQAFQFIRGLRIAERLADSDDQPGARETPLERIRSLDRRSSHNDTSDTYAAGHPDGLQSLFSSLLILFNDAQSFLSYLRQRLSAGMLTTGCVATRPRIIQPRERQIDCQCRRGFPCSHQRSTVRRLLDPKCYDRSRLELLRSLLRTPGQIALPNQQTDPKDRTMTPDPG